MGVKKKICIISISLAKGGLERFCANLSILLSDSGYDVHLVTLNNEIDYEYKGELFNLGLYKSDNDTPLKRINRFRKLRAYFQEQQFDYILDNRIGNRAARELFYAFYIYGKSRVIYMQHSGKLQNHFPEKSLMTEFVVHYATAFVGVSQSICDKFNKKNHTDKCQLIYNFANPLEAQSHSSVYPDNYILYLGRLDEETKNFSLMLEGYKASRLSPDTKLVIMGDGDDESDLRRKVEQLSLSQSVVFKPFSPSIHAALTNAKFSILTSRYEGFPMTLVEALSCGTPLVSVDCDSGPREIIQHEHNGLLVENHNPNALASAMNRMLEDAELYLRCKANARDSIKHLDRGVIVEQWKGLLS